MRDRSDALRAAGESSARPTRRSPRSAQALAPRLEPEGDASRLHASRSRRNSRFICCGSTRRRTSRTSGPHNAIPPQAAARDRVHRRASARRSDALRNRARARDEPRPFRPCVSPRRRGCRRIDIVLERRIERAKSLLRDTDLPITEIAHRDRLREPQPLLRHLPSRDGAARRATFAARRRRLARRSARRAAKIAVRARGES